jgi:hypothetical protein
MGRGKRRFVSREAPLGHVIPLSDERWRKLPDGLRESLREALAGEEGKIDPSALATGLGCRVHRLRGGPSIGKALAIELGLVWVNDILNFVVGTATIMTDGRLRVNGRRGLADVALDAEPGSATVVSVTDSEIVGRLLCATASSTALVFDRDDAPIGRVYPNRGQVLDLRLAGAAAYCLFELDLPTRGS